MRALTDAELLSVWERGLGQPPVHRILNLLAASAPETRPDDWAAMSVGRRDACLLALRERTFGSRIVGLATCPECCQQSEVTFEAEQIRAEPPAGQSTTLAIDIAGCQLRFRLPNSLDVAAVENAASVEVARTVLLGRCLVSDECDGEPLPAGQLSAELADDIAARMSAADPQADVRLECTCPACGRAWQTTFDIVSFFWTEISAWASRTLREIHILASAYGWREADILALSATRRRLYMELVDR